MLLALAITNKCTYNCRHCGVGSSPDDSNNLTVDEMCEYIDQFATLSAGKELHVSITGGEPFLRFQDLVTVIQHANSKNASDIGCVTNCFWANSLPTARSKLKLLKEAGLKNIAFSYDSFHKEYVNLNNIRNAFIASNEIGIKSGFKVVMFRGSYGAHDLLLDLGNALLDKSFTLQAIRCIPVGNAAKLPSDLFLYAPTTPSETCNGFGAFVVYADHNVYPCCEPGRPEMLWLGSTKRDSLEGIIESANSNPLFKILIHRGPSFFLPFLERAGISLSELRFVNKCHLCQVVLNTIASNEAAYAAYCDAVESWEKEVESAKKIVGLFESFFGEKQ